MNIIAMKAKISQIIGVLCNENCQIITKKGVIDMKKSVFFLILLMFLVFSCEDDIRVVKLVPGSAEILEIQFVEAKGSDEQKTNEVEGGEIDPSSKWIKTRPQGVQLARMFVNEDDRPLRKKPNGTEGEMTIDHVMISRVVYGNRHTKSTFSNWMQVMKFLSPHVGRVRKIKRHRHEWTSQLPGFGNSPPKSWIDCRSVDRGDKCDGNWRIHGKLWVKFREQVVDYWLSKNLTFMFVTEEKTSKPRKWGNRQDVIRFLSRHKRLCVLGVGDRNFFLARNGEGCNRNDNVTQAARFGKRPNET